MTSSSVGGDGWERVVRSTSGIIRPQTPRVHQRRWGSIGPELIAPVQSHWDRDALDAVLIRMRFREPPGMLRFPDRGASCRAGTMGDNQMGDPKLLTPREASEVLHVGYTTLKQWIYAKKLRTVKTPGGHHRIPESEIDRLLPRKTEKDSLETRRKYFRRISGRNQLLGRIVDVRFDGLLAQVTISIAGQRINSIITADAARELRLKRGQIAVALIKSTEVMIIRPG